MFYDNADYSLNTDQRRMDDNELDAVGTWDESMSSSVWLLVKEYEAIIRRKLEKIQSDMPAYKTGSFECVQFVDRYVNKLKGSAKGTRFMGKKIYNIYSSPLSLPAGFKPQIVTPDPDFLIKYFEKYSICSNHKTNKKQIAKPKNYGIYRQGPTGRPLALVDRFKKYETGDVSGLKQGWYLERGRPSYNKQCRATYDIPCTPRQTKQCKPVEVKDDYKRVKDTKGKPILLTPGFYRIYTVSNKTPNV